MSKDKQKKIDNKFRTVLHYLDDISHLVRGLRSAIKIINRINGSEEDDEDEEDEEE
jgi:hypothetical protein